MTLQYVMHTPLRERRPLDEFIYTTSVFGAHQLL